MLLTIFILKEKPLKHIFFSSFTRNLHPLDSIDRGNASLARMYKCALMLKWLYRNFHWML